MQTATVQKQIELQTAYEECFNNMTSIIPKGAELSREILRNGFLKPV
jgi:hypothetical protein